jgi:hypothetical protein
MRVYGYSPMKCALSLQMGGPQTCQRPPFLDVTEAQRIALNSGLEQIKSMG